LNQAKYPTASEPVQVGKLGQIADSDQWNEERRRQRAPMSAMPGGQASGAGFVPDID
jgi:hypothetical protein